MTSDIKREVIKALAYGKTNEEIKLCMGASDDDIRSINKSEVNVKRAELTAKGYIR